MALGVSAYSETPFGAEASDVIAYPLGIEMTMQENAPAVTGDANVPVTGQVLTGTLGTADGSSLVRVDLTGQALTAAEGTLTQSSNQEIDVTGFELTLQASNPTNDTLTAFGEAPFATLSPTTFNIPVEVEATTGGIVGTFPLPMSLGNVTEITGDANVPVTGQALTFNLDSVSITANANVDITGQALTSNLGTATLDANTFASVSGEAMTAEEGTVFAFADVDVAVTGQELTMQENAPDVTGDANVSVTGIGFTANLGTAELDANTLVDLTGQAVIMQEGTATAPDSLAILTGIEMTMAQGSVKNVIWNPVDTGTIQPWTEVDTAA